MTSVVLTPSEDQTAALQQWPDMRAWQNRSRNPLYPIQRPEETR